MEIVKSVCVISLLCILFVCVIYTFMFLNPDLNDFKCYVSDQVDDSLGHGIVSKFVALLAGELSGIAVDRQDFKVYSIFTLNVGVVEIKYLGILGKFFEIGRSDPLYYSE